VPVAGNGSDVVTDGALSGLRIIDFTRILAGPWASQVLADLGAEVIKIEQPGRGDDTRAWGPPFFGDTGDEGAPVSAYYLSANRNKKSVALNIATPRGADIARALVRDADVLMENFKVGALARYGLDYASLSRDQPQLIYCSITGFGQTGPYSNRPGYDFMIQGLGGLMSVTGEPDGAPQKVGVALTDVLTGLYAAIGVLAALTHRARTGKGQYIDLALLDVQVACLANQALNYLVSGAPPSRLGNAHPNIVPYQAFATSDGHIIVTVGNDSQFARLCDVVERPQWARDPRFATNASRVSNREIIVPLLADRLAAAGSAHWLALLDAAGVPCGPINDVAQVFADEHVRHREMRIELDTGRHGPVPGVASPLRLSGTPARYVTPPPALGAHTRDVLRDRLQLTDQELDALYADGVVG